MGNYFLQNYKIRKYFLQNLLRKVFYTKYFAKKLATISYKYFFITKFISISYRKKFKTKLVRNMSFFSSVGLKNDKPIDILNYIKRINFFPNAYIMYRIILTILV